MAKGHVYTIGYGSRTLDELISTLQSHGVEYLVDVRSSPYSKFKPEFTKDALSVSLPDRGISYVFMGDTLGGRPDDPGCYINGKVDYVKLGESASYRKGIERLHTGIDKGFTLVLMCSEGKPQECHRGKLIGQTLQDEGIEVRHIDEVGEIKSQVEVIVSLTHGQQALFGTPPVVSTSRKGYKKGTEEKG